MSVVTKLENKIKNYIDSLTSSQKYIFLSAIIIGLMAHGFALFNRLSVHDNSHCLFTIGATYEVNRWMLGIIYKLQVFTTKTFSLPLFNGFLSIIFIACAGMILVKIFDIKSTLLAVIMGGLMITFPMVTSSFSFMFTTWPYFMGLLFVFKAVYTLTRELTVKNLIISSLWLTLCLGLYQAFLGVAITLFLLKMLVDVVDAKTDSVAAYAKQGVAYLVEMGLGLVLWYGIGTAFRTVKHIELETYKGWDEGYNIAKFPGKLVAALKSFLTFRMEGINALRYLRMLALLIFVIAVVMIIILLIKSQTKLAVRISAIVGVLFMPVGMVIVYLLSTSDSYQVSTMMLYAEVFVYIIPLVLLEKFDGFEGKLLDLASQAISAVLILCTVIVAVGYIYLDNAAYFKAAIYQEQAIVYCTALLSNIKSIDGFTDDKEIVIVGFNNIQDKTVNEVTINEEFEGIKLEKYYDSLEEMINYGVNIQFLRDHIGIGNDKLRIEDPNVETEVSDMPEVKAMPTYPNEGSIAIIDDMIVVKMGDPLPY